MYVGGIWWVNNTELIITDLNVMNEDENLGEDEYLGSPATPNTTFPFPRLASVHSLKAITYVYHQMDIFTLAENSFNWNTSRWEASTNITLTN